MARGDAATDAVGLDPEGRRDALAAPLETLLASDAILRVDRILARLRSYEAEFLRLESRAAEVLDAAIFVDDADAFLLLRPMQAHSSGLTRLAYVYSVLSRSRDAVVFTDATAAILGASGRWLELYGLAPAAVLGCNPRIVNSRQLPRSFFRAVWQDLTDRSLGSWSGELINRRASGEPIRVWQTITTFRDAEDAVAGYLGVTRDLTSYREVIERLEASNRELERRSRIDEASAESEAVAALGPASETRPGVAASSSVPVPRAPDGAGTHAEPLERLYLRTIARTERDLIADFAAGRGVRIRIGEEGLSLPTLGDKRRLSRAIAEIFRTAIAAARPGGEVAIRLRQADDGSQEVSVRASPAADADVGGERTFAADASEAAAALEAEFAARVAATHGGSLIAERRQNGDSFLTLRVPLDWSQFARRLWAVAIFDPSEILWPVVGERLRAEGLPAFVAQRDEDLRRVCRQELPNVLIHPADLPLPDGCRAFPAAAAGPELVPAVCGMRRHERAARLTLVSVEGPPSLVGDLERLFAAGSRFADSDPAHAAGEPGGR